MQAGSLLELHPSRLQIHQVDLLDQHDTHPYHQTLAYHPQT